MRSVLTLVLTALLLSNLSVSASDSEVGVVWMPDGSAEAQVQTLRTMADHQIRHVRVLDWPHAEALQAATTLQIQLYVDLHAPPDPNDDRLTHPAVRGAGWAGPLTAQGCTTWMQVRTQLPADRLRYVVAPVSPTGAACQFDDATTVLADVRLMDRPFARWYQWRQAHDGPVGLAALGTARTGSGPEGWRVPRSAAAQARTLERLLTEVHTRNVPLTFTAAWTSASNWGPLHFHLTERDSLLPPGQVVAAATTHAPRPFVWPPGPTTTSSSGLPIGTTAAVWLLLGGTAAAFFYLPPVRRTVLRYLFAHAFYRDAMRTGRDATPLTCTVLLTLMGGALWVGGYAVLAESAWLRPTLLAVEGLPPPLQSVANAAWTTPVRTAGLVTGGLIGGLLIWASGVALALRAAGTSLSWSQTFVLGLVPWWGTLLWMFAAITPLSALRPHIPLVLLGLALVASMWTALRTAHDVFYTARAPLVLALGAALFAPGSLLLILLVSVGYATEVPVQWISTLLWHA